MAEATAYATRASQEDRTIWEIGADLMIDNIKNNRPMVSAVRNHTGLSGNVWQNSNYDVLEQTAIQKGYTDGRWAGDREAERLGFWKNKGEKAVLLENLRRNKRGLLIDAETGEVDRTRTGMPKYESIRLRQPESYLFPVFNASQLRNVPPVEHIPHKLDPVSRGYELLHSSGPAVVHDQLDREHFNTITQTIHMKAPEAYQTREEYVKKGLEILVEAMSHENNVRTAEQSYDGNDVRDQLAYHKAYVRLCREVGLGVDPHHNADKAFVFADELSDNPHIFKDSSRLAESIIRQIDRRERNRHPDLEPMGQIERSALRFVSPRNEIERLRDFQRLMNDVENNPSSVITVQHEGKELFAREENVYQRPQISPEPGVSFPVVYRSWAYDRQGNEYELLKTQHFTQQDDGSSLPDPVPPKYEANKTVREVHFPLDWTGDLVVASASIDKMDNEIVIQSAYDEHASLFAVGAKRPDDSTVTIKMFNDKEAAAQWASIYEDEFARQTNRQEQSIEGRTFFDVKDVARSTLREMDLTWNGEVRAYGTNNQEKIPACIKAFGQPINVEQRLAELEQSKQQAQKTNSLRCFDVPKGKEGLAYEVGLAHSKKYDQWYARSKVNIDKVKKYFTEVPPKGVTKTVPENTPEKTAANDFVQTAPIPPSGEKQVFAEPATLLVFPEDTMNVEAKGAVYNATEGVWQAPAGADVREFENFLPENNMDADNTMLSPRTEAQLVLKSLGIDLPNMPEATGKTVETDKAVYVLHPDGCMYAKNLESGQQVYHAPKGYEMTEQRREQVKQAVMEALDKGSAESIQKMDANAKDIEKMFESMSELSKPNKVTKALEIAPISGLYSPSTTSLIAPRVNEHGEVKSAQYWKVDGSEHSAKDTQTTGTYVQIGGKDDGKIILVAKSLREAAAVAQCSGHPVKALLENENIIPTCVALRTANPDKQIVILGSEIDQEVAKKAAQLSSGVVLQPSGKSADGSRSLTFREMADSGLEGQEKVSRVISRCVEKETAKLEAKKERSGERENRGRQQERGRE